VATKSIAEDITPFIACDPRVTRTNQATHDYIQLDSRQNPPEVLQHFNLCWDSNLMPSGETSSLHSFIYRGRTNYRPRTHSHPFLSDIFHDAWKTIEYSDISRRLKKSRTRMSHQNTLPRHESCGECTRSAPQWFVSMWLVPFGITTTHVSSQLLLSDSDQKEWTALILLERRW
jgi:hypothetical protein